MTRGNTVREVLNTRDKREAIKRYISANPELSNRKIAQYWDVDEGTIRNYKQKIGAETSAENNQKARKFPHPETDNLPVVMVKDIPFDAEKIQDAMMVLLDKITELEKATHYLKNFFPHQIFDAISTTSYIDALEFFEDALTQTNKLFQEVINERNSERI